ncbi:post-GPI attachment to proteins factor 3 [Anthonomus grandis grandis]|uniref:post-GPI attachment to proteins factor 3 n=1 Tax=Anthonomus grandis grandis TaxID=2921223 RepID=UPI002166BB0F|nr:post-GPI attachment to proteins factor 3 [Anthonomus grandis grandis]
MLSNMPIKLLPVITFLVFFKTVWASIGDRSPHYERCVYNCRTANCSEDGEGFVSGYKQPLHLKLTAWSCLDECRYNCMWETVDSFHKRNWKTPQFHGKWPFIRFLGIQEPASVMFSLLNLFAHLIMIRKFNKFVRPDSPLYWLWFVYCVVCCHAWLWSAIFHTRDFPITELFDYSCAFSIVLVNCYVMSVRVLRYFLNRSLLMALTVSFLAFFISHTAYLSMGKFDYDYNMKLNIIVGTFTALCWFLWCVIHKNRQPYVWKCTLYVTLAGLVLLLELIDQPPIFYIFDYHSLWHLATAPLVFIVYSFAIDDCRYLRKTETQMREDKVKNR